MSKDQVLDLLLSLINTNTIYKKSDATKHLQIICKWLDKMMVSLKILEQNNFKQNNLHLSDQPTNSLLAKITASKNWSIWRDDDSQIHYLNWTRFDSVYQAMFLLFSLRLIYVVRAFNFLEKPDANCKLSLLKRR